MAIYHLTVRTGTRTKGTVAAKKSDYIQRENQYESQSDKCTYKESDHMPDFAKDNPRSYWQAADDYERSNGRLFVEVEFALPKELKKEERIQLAHDYAQSLTQQNNLPYTLAIHEGKGHNPHAHLIISERQNDGIQREPQDWFKRANTHHPEQGGAYKSDEFKHSSHIRAIREQWAEKANTALEHSGSNERIDHRTLEAQGIDRTPTQHIGPTTYAMAERGIKSERLQTLEHQREEEKSIERELHHAERRIERQLRQIARDSEPDRSHQQHQPGRDQPHRDHPGRDPDSGKPDKQPQRQYDQGLEL